jgi:hypothetical protein
MGIPLQEDQFAKVFIHCDKDPFFRYRPFKDNAVAGIRSPFFCFNNVMPLLPQPHDARRICPPETSPTGNLYHIKRIMRDDRMGIGKACLDIRGLQVRVIGEDRIGRFTLRQKA